MSCCRVLQEKCRWSDSPCLGLLTPQKVPKYPWPSVYLSLPWTGLLVCRGVEGPDSSEEAVHWGVRGSVLCPVEPSLQDSSGDSEMERGAL